MEGGRCVGVVAIGGVERGNTSRGVDVGVVGKLGGRQVVSPVVVKGMCISTKDLLQSAVGSFGLSIGLGVVTRRNSRAKVELQMSLVKRGSRSEIKTRGRP